MKFLIDKEVNLSSCDLLNSGIYADTLTEVIEAAPADSCFTIGLFGEWGSGKSSIIKTVQDKYAQANKGKTKFILYDAWKYSNDSFRRMFLLKVKEELNFEEQDTFASFYTNKTSDVTIKRKFDFRYIFFSAIILLAGLFAIWKFSGKVDTQVTIAVIISAFSLIITWLGRSFNDHKVTVAQPLFFAAEQFEECFDEMVSTALAKISLVGRLFKWIKGEQYVGGLDRIVFVIDNIDRCPKEVAFELVTNIKNFLGKQKNIIFIIPVDDLALKKHIMRGGQAEAKEAEEFLRKFFNVTLRIKPFKSYDLFDLAKSLNQQNAFGFNADTLDIISKEYASNPRRIIQFFNNLASELHVFSKKDSAEFATKYQSLICKCLILREEWPDYYQKLARNPSLLNNADEAINKYTGDEKNADLQSFLSVTNSINQFVENDIIEKIFSVFDRGLKIPSTIMEAINKKQVDIILKGLDDNLIKQSDLINTLIELLDGAVKQKRFRTSANNIFEIICHVNEKENLQPSDNRRVMELARPKVHDIVPFIQDYEVFCKYLFHIAGSYKYLKDATKNYLTSNISTQSQDPEFQVAEKLLRAYLHICPDNEALADFAQLATISLARTKNSFTSYQLPPEKLRLLIDKGTFEHLLKDMKEATPEDAGFKEIQSLSEQINFHGPELELLFFKLNELHGSFDNMDRDALAGLVLNVNSVLRNQKPAYQPGDSSEQLTIFINKFATNRLQRGQRVSYIQEQLTEAAFTECLGLFTNSYKIAGEKIDILGAVQTIISRSPQCTDYLCSGLLGFAENFHFNLVPLKSFLLDLDNNSVVCLALKKHLLSLKTGDVYVVDDTEAGAFVTTLVRRYFDGNETVTPFLEDITEESRTRGLFAEIVSSHEASFIAKLSPKLQVILFDFITRNDKIFQYENEL